MNIFERFMPKKDGVSKDSQSGESFKKERTPEQEDILRRLEKAKKSEERVRTFASIADTYGLDAIVSLIPELGDAGSSVVSGIYLLFEAKRAGLDKSDYLKIISLQTADFFAGGVPIAGDAVDYLFKANKISSKLFEKKAAEIKEEAKRAGITESDIAKIDEAASSLPQLVERAVHAFAPKKERKDSSQAA